MKMMSWHVWKEVKKRETESREADEMNQEVDSEVTYKVFHD